MDERLAAEVGIRQLHARSADAVWRKDGRAFADCYTEDGEWKIAGLHLIGRDAIARALGDLGAANARVFMSFGAPLLEIGADCATGRTHVVEHVKRRDGGAAKTLGVYYERFVHRNGRWLFRWRHFDFLYFGNVDLSDPFYPFEDYGPPPAMPGSDAPTAGLRV